MLLTNILLSFIIFCLVLIFGILIDIKTKLGNEEYLKVQKFYKSLTNSIKKKKEVKNEK